MPQYVRVCPPLVSFLHGTVKFTYKNLLSLCVKELEFWKERCRSRLSQCVQQRMFLNVRWTIAVATATRV
jgi:hypothetical protein